LPTSPTSCAPRLEEEEEEEEEGPGKKKPLACYLSTLHKALRAATILPSTTGTEPGRGDGERRRRKRRRG